MKQLPCVKDATSNCQHRGAANGKGAKRIDAGLCCLESSNGSGKKMLPKFRRCNRFVRHRTLPFLPFARSMALLHASKKLKRQHHNSEYKEKLVQPTSKGQGSVKDAILTNNAALSDSSSDESEGLVQADFVFSDPKTCDFHGVKLLLQSYLDVMEWDLSGFVDLILGQTTVGSVVKVENDDDDGVYGFITALSMGRYKDHKCFKELKEYLIKVCQEDDSLSSLRSLLVERAHTVGLLVSQRVVNFPPQLLPHLYDALFDEVSWATEDEPTKQLRNSFCFKSFILVCKVYKGRDTHKKRERSNRNSDGMIYTKPEDEIFHELSSCSFTFRLHNQQVAANELRDYRLTGLVMVVDASKISSFRKKLHSLIDEL